MDWVIIMSRAGLLLALIAIYCLMWFIRRRNQAAKQWTGPLMGLTLFYIGFYLLSILFRLGLFHPPSSYFFTHLSNARTWYTVGVALTVLVPVAKDLWITGQR